MYLTKIIQNKDNSLLEHDLDNYLNNIPEGYELYNVYYNTDTCISNYNFTQTINSVLVILRRTY